MHATLQDIRLKMHSPRAFCRGCLGRRSSSVDACLALRQGWILLIAALLVTTVAKPIRLWSAPRDVSSSQSAQSVEAYDFVEVTLNVSGPDAKNPFADASVQGEFGKVGTALACRWMVSVIHRTVACFVSASCPPLRAITLTQSLISKEGSARASREPSRR